MLRRRHLGSGKRDKGGDDVMASEFVLDFLVFLMNFELTEGLVLRL